MVIYEEAEDEFDRLQVNSNAYDELDLSDPDPVIRYKLQ